MGIQINGQTDTISAVDGSITVATDLTVPGALTYDDVTNIDSVGIITAQSGINVTGGNVKIGTTTAGQSEADDLTIATSAHTGMTIRSGATSKGAVYFSDGTSGNNEYRGVLEYNHSDDHFRILTAASERLRVTSTGDVGINCTPNSNAGINLHIHGDNTTSEIRLTNTTTGTGANGSYIQQGGNTLYIGNSESGNTVFEVNGSERFRIKSDGAAYFSGNLGLGGQTSPSGTIHINDLSANGYELKVTGNALQFNRSSNSYIDQLHDTGSILFRMTSSNTEAMRIMSDGTVKIGTGTGNPILMLNASTSGTSVIQMGDSADNNIGQIHYVNSDDSMRFFTNNAERLRIDDVGRLTITGQGLKLSANNSSLYSLDGSLSYYATNNGVYLNGAGTNGWLRLNASGAENDQNSINIWGASGGARIEMRTNNVERLRITSDGKVGVRVTNPDLTLHVNGVNALPSSSGSTPTGHLTLRAKATSSSHGMFMGVSNASPWSSWIQAQDANNNATNYPLLLNPNGGNVGVGIDSPGEHLHISGAVRRDTPGSSNIKFLEFSFELPSGSTTTIARVTGPVVSSMAIAKFEYVGLYDYADVGFYSGVEMASLRRSNSNSAYTYLQNSEIHAGGNNSSYQPNMFWQNGSNNTSELMITTGSYVIIMGTIRITTYNLGLSRVISI